MEYKFVTTIQGPVVQGEDEILFLNQFGQLLDYVEEDPEFLDKVKDYVASGLRDVASSVADSLTVPVVGGDQTPALYGFISAVSHLKQFEHNYLRSVGKPN
jgi:hypothetical protein